MAIHKPVCYAGFNTRNRTKTRIFNTNICWLSVCLVSRHTGPIGNWALHSYQSQVAGSASSLERVAQQPSFAGQGQKHYGGLRDEKRFTDVFTSAPRARRLRSSRFRSNGLDRLSFGNNHGPERRRRGWGFCESRE